MAILYKLFLLLISFASQIHAHSNHTILEQALKNIRIIDNADYYQNVGYDNNLIQTNGELAVIQRLINKLDVVFDVGANKGDWSSLVVQYHNDVKIFAFEPIIPVYNILKNSLTNFNAECFNIALADKEEIKNFFYYSTPGHTELSGLYYRPILDTLLINSKPINIKVQAQTLDLFCKSHDVNHINFLKIDTEGAEFTVLKGAHELLRKKAIDIIQFEYGGTYIDSQITLQMVYNFLKQNDYKLFRIIPEGLVEISEWNDSLENYRYSNYLAIVKGN